MAPIITDRQHIIDQLVDRYNQTYHIYLQNTPKMTIYTNDASGKRRALRWDLRDIRVVAKADLRASD